MNGFSTTVEFPACDCRDCRDSRNPAAGYREAVFLEINWVCPVTPAAKHLGFFARGCYTVGLAVGTRPVRVIKAFETAREARGYASDLGIPLSIWSI